MKKIWLLSLLVLMGCQTTQKVRNDDLYSWENASVSQLRSHPIFSTLPVERKSVDSFEYTLTYTDQKVVSTGHPECFGANNGDDKGIDEPAKGQICTHRLVYEDDCKHRFLIRNNKVIKYKVLGDSCFTTCKYQPIPCLHE